MYTEITKMITHQLNTFCSKSLLQSCRGCLWSRPFSTSAPLLSRKQSPREGFQKPHYRRPIDRRWQISTKDIGPTKKGGSSEIAKEFGKRGGMPSPPGYIDKDGNFNLIPEMVPEFVVPDLKDFELKPYVSYSATDVKQSEFTAKNLFDECYGKKVLQAVKEKGVDINTVIKNKEEYLKKPS